MFKKPKPTTYSLDVWLCGHYGGTYTFRTEAERGIFVAQAKRGESYMQRLNLTTGTIWVRPSSVDCYGLGED